jgi:hypothetical protein
MASPPGVGDDVCLSMDWTLRQFDHQRGFEFPTIRVAPKGKRSVELLSQDRLEPIIRVDVTKPIASGRTGRIYRAESVDGWGPYRTLVVKQNVGNVSFEDEFAEMLIHQLLMCEIRLQGRWELRREAARLGVAAPFIPKLVLYGKSVPLKGRGRGGRVCTAMQAVDSTLESVLEDNPGALVDCLKQVCVLLKYLQDKFKFMHRDLHTHNVMIRKGPPMRVALIDFGMSRMVAPMTGKRGGVRVGFGKGDHIYAGAHGFNPSLDLVTLLYDINADNMLKRVLPGLYERVLLPVERKIQGGAGRAIGAIRKEMWRLTRENDGIHKAFYARSVPVVFRECTPDAVLNALCVS